MAAIKVIDAERRRLDVSQRKLCQAAKINPSTYGRLKSGRCSGMERTFDKLRNALVLIAQREAAE